MLFGLGNAGKDMEDGFLSKIGSSLASQCNANKKVSTCSIVLPPAFPIDDAPLADLSSDFYSTLYADNRYRTGDKIDIKAEDLKSVTIVAEGGVSNADAASAAIEAGKHLANGVALTKDIVNAPHNVLNSESLANVAKRIADESGGTIKCLILDKEECEKRGMGAYLGVARGSETEPQFIHLTYTPKNGNIVKKVGIVGKGLLFDTGGYNIKTAMMELMKFDCGGSVSVLDANDRLIFPLNIDIFNLYVQMS
jgi:leucyl aminopeptidase